MIKSKTVDEYIKAAPEEIRGRLSVIRSAIKKVAPDSEEKISYGMPYYGYNGRLVYFAYFKNHIGIYIMPKYLVGFSEEIKKYQTGKATLQIYHNEKLPINLITKILKNAVKIIENDTKN